MNNSQRLLVPFHVIDACARRAGLVVVSCLGRSQIETAMKKEEPRLIAWQGAGYAGDMKYMTRPSSLICRPEELLPEYKSIICFFVNYRNSARKFATEIPVGHGRVSLYAQGRDYHAVIKERIDRFIDDFKDSPGLKGELKARIFCDAVPTMERALALAGGAGFIGKNSMFIKPGLGSFGFLGEVIWNVELEGQKTSGSFIGVDGCRSCSRCVRQCPTGAIVRDRVIDANKCISYLTIEKKGYLSEVEARSIGSCLFGCDECQLCCPYNNDICPLTDVNEFCEDVTELSPRLLDVMDFTVESFRRKFEQTALMRAGRESLVRNACIVAANTSFVEAVPRLLYLNSNDSSETIRRQSAATLEILRAIK